MKQIKRKELPKGVHVDFDKFKKELAKQGVRIRQSSYKEIVDLLYEKKEIEEKIEERLNELQQFK